MAPVLSPLFFHHTNKTTGLILTFSIFALAYLCRPLGGLLFGYIGDRYGRARSLITSGALMASATLLIAFIPNPTHYPTLSALLLLVFRLLQGLALGGEYSGAMIYGAESGYRRHLTLFSALPNTAANIGIILCTALIALLTGHLSAHALASWGWRLPFLLIGLIGFALFALRTSLTETPEFTALPNKTERPIRTLLKTNKLPFIIIFLLIWNSSTVFYTTAIYMPTFLSSFKIVSLSTALTITTYNTLLMLLLVPCISLLADKLGCRPIIMTFAIATFMFAWPCFYGLVSTKWTWIILSLLTLTIITSLSQGTLPRICTALFPTTIRFSGVSFIYNLSYGIFGGTMPLIATLLTKQHQHWYLLPIYMMVTATISFVTIVTLLKRITLD